MRLEEYGNRMEELEAEEEADSSTLTPCWPGQAPCGACEACVPDEGPDLDIDLNIEVTEAEVEISAALNGTTITVSVPNDGHDRREEVGFLASLLPQLLQHSFDALEAS